MTSLKDKVVLVTGASAGIGFAITEALTRHGAKVVAVARNIDKIQALNRTLGTERAIKTDVTKEAEIVALFQQVQLKLGRLDVLINNAGMVAASAELVDGTVKAWKDMLDVTPFQFSVHGHGAAPASPGHQFYAATKHIVTALTEGLRKSVQSKNIRVTSLSPGFVETEMGERAYGKEAGRSFYTQLNYKVLEPKDVADAVVFILTAPSLSCQH